MARLKDIASAAGIDAGLAQRFIDSVAAHLIEGERVTIERFGTFRLTPRKARTFKTALMDKPVDKPVRYAITFKPSGSLLKQLPLPTPDSNIES